MMTSIHSGIARRSMAKMLPVLICGFLVQGCSTGFPHYSGPKKAPVEQNAAVTPVKTTTTASVKPKKSNTAVVRTTSSKHKTTDLALSVTYLVRLMVPPGSELVVSAEGASDGTPSIKTIATQSGPPYVIDLPVDSAEDAYPMTVNATLTSQLGHVLTGSVVLKEPPTKSVEITMAPSS